MRPPAAGRAIGISTDARNEPSAVSNVASLNRSVPSGWLAVIQHYFAAAWVPPASDESRYYSKAREGRRFVLGVLSPEKVVAAGGEGGVELAIERATEELQRRLRAKESELRIAERRVRALEATQRDLANELVAASRLVDEVGDPTQLAAELRELEERHGAALELMGETSEENEELRDRVDALKETVNALTQQLAANDAPGGA